MDFDQIPSYGAGKSITDTSPRGWLARNRRWLVALTICVVLLDILATAYYVAPAILASPPGGLDGCVVAADGTPAVATVRVGEAARQTYPDGCFFFAELPPGPGQLSVETSAGVVWTQEVEILSGEAVALGTVSLP
jgi:hypothetical protein